MPVEIAPNRIELSSFDGGFAPDPAEAGLPADHLPEVSNLIIDPATGGLEMRPGYSRVGSSRVAALAGTHWFRHVNYYEVIDGGVRKRFLICVATDAAAATDNVRLYAYDIVNDSMARIDTAGVQWTHPNAEHFYAIAEGTYYGAGGGEKIYSWHPTNGWDADACLPSVKTWTVSTGNSVDTTTELAKNYAYKKNQQVLKSGKYYKTSRGIRYHTWETGEKYKKGEKVSRKVDHGTKTYWRSFECTDSHTASSTNRPGDGSGGDPGDNWKNIRLKNPLDEDSEITSDWFLNPVPRKGRVGAYHGNRLFVREQDGDNWSRLKYSAPAKPERGADVADLVFDPTDWAPVDDNDGDGGGWMDVPFSGKGDQIRALVSYGNYLLIFGRWQTYVLAGVNEQSWTLRKLGDYGVPRQGAVCEYDGIIYFISLTGNVCRTDGTSMEVVEENAKVYEYLKKKMADIGSAANETSYNWSPGIMQNGKFLWLSFPDPGSLTNNVTVVYHPPSKTFWPTNIPILDMASGENSGRQDLFFSAPITGASTETPTIFRLLNNPLNATYTDDDWRGLSGSASTNAISWSLRSAWFQFGVTRNQRRIRRLWALVKGVAAQTVQIDMLKDFEEDDYTTATRTLTGADQSEFVEGKVATTVAHAVAVELSGSASTVTNVVGVGLDTEPIRTRFKRD